MSGLLRIERMEEREGPGFLLMEQAESSSTAASSNISLTYNDLTRRSSKAS